jgi:hypothetical protein
VRAARGALVLALSVLMAGGLPGSPAAVRADAVSPGSASADAACEIEGSLSGVEIAVRQPRGLRRVQLASPRRVIVTPLRPGIARVRTVDGGVTIEGTTRAPLRFALARALALRDGALELPRGLPLDRVDLAPRGPWALVDARLGDGVSLRAIPLACDMLEVVVEAPPIIARAEARASRGPRWRARTARLYVFPEPDGDDALRLDLAPEATARFEERTRRRGWVELSLVTALGARVRAWARDTELVRGSR